MRICEIQWLWSSASALSHRQPLTELASLIALRTEVECVTFASRSLLEVYLGHNASRRVLTGDFKRGTGQSIHAAIWFCDLRGFTSLGDRTPPREFVRMLDRYFETVGHPIAENGGEILKFIGDALYGNIGARDRLDFTVIGAAVNEACRVESLCKELG